MTTAQSYVPYDVSNVTNYKLWAQAIGAFLTAAGWTKTADPGQVNWANVAIAPFGSPIVNSWTGVTAWSNSANYTGVNLNNGGAIGPVTYGGLTYACFISNFLTTNHVVLQNTSNTLTVTAVTASGNTGVYACTGAATAMVGMFFVVTAGGSNLDSRNVGTFICTAASVGVSITLQNAAAFTQASVTGGSPGAQAISSASNASINNQAATFLGVSYATGAMIGHTISMSGWSGGFSGNNQTNLPVIANQANAATGILWVLVTATLSSGSQAGVTIWDSTNPTTDQSHWCPYNYEVWQSNDSLSSTMPIFLRLLYDRQTSGQSVPYIKFMVGTATTGTGWISGNMISQTEQVIGVTSGTGTGSILWESDFSYDAVAPGNISLLMWRAAVTSTTTAPVFFIIERARDASGNSLDAYISVAWGQSTASGWVAIFKPGNGNIISSSGGVPTISVADASTSFLVNGLAPASPIFPFVGYVGNPGLGAVFMRNADCTEGGLLNVVIYNTSHTYLMCKSMGATKALSNQTSTACGAVGIRWE